MVQYCRKCGKELDDDAEFCEKCGFQVNDNPTKETKPTEQNTPDKNEFAAKLPLILAIIGIIVSFAEGMGTPMLMGWQSILIAMVIGIVGGLIGILLMEKLDEPLIAAVEFIATGVLIYLFIARFGEISTVIFIITAVLALYFKGHHTKNKKLFAIPILTVVLIFAVIIASGVIYQANAENSIAVGNITPDIKYDGYNYYDGHIVGDIYVGTNFEYLKVTVDYYDNQNKVIDSSIAWNELNPDSGKTYKFDGYYFNQKQPVRAEIKVFDSATSKTPLYGENVTLSTGSAVSGV